MAEIGTVVEREPVTGHPSRDSNPNRGKFFLTDPDPGQPVNSPAGNAVIRCDPNEHFLEVSNVTVHVAPIGLEVHDWVADDLSGPVVGDIAAPPGLEHVNAARRERFCCRQDVRASTVASNAESQDGGMFDKQEGVSDLVRSAFFDEPTLQIECVAIRDDAEPTNFERAHRVIESMMWGSAFRRIEPAEARLPRVNYQITRLPNHQMETGR
jgi:hypothetical protein